MADPHPADEVQGGLSEQEKRNNVIRLAFGGSTEEFERFCCALEEFVPPGTTAILRGSSITGKRWRDDAPFDSRGPGTSDLDVTLVGDGGVVYFNNPGGFYFPGVHSIPLSEKHPDIAPQLVELRERLMAMVNRPVNIQASREFIKQVRGDLFDQPYLTLFVKPAGLALNG